MKKIIYLLILIIILSLDSAAIGYWQCDLKDHSCSSTCIGNIFECLDKPLCSCNENDNTEIIVPKPNNDNEPFIPLEITIKEISDYQTTSKILFDISANKKSKITLQDNDGKIKTLCRKCLHVKKKLKFRSGEHHVIITVQNNDEKITKEINFIVDTKKNFMQKILS